MISYKIENFKVLDDVVYIYYTDEQGLKRVWLTDREIAWRFKWKRSMVLDRILQHMGEYCIIWKEI